METKWKSLATENHAKKNYSLVKGVPVTSVTLQMMEGSGGVSYWDDMVVQVPGKHVAPKAASKRSSANAADAPPPEKAQKTAARNANSKGDANSKAAANRVVQENEKKVKQILSSWQLQVNSMNRIAELVEKMHQSGSGLSTTLPLSKKLRTT